MSDRLRLLLVPHAYLPARGGTEQLCQRVAECAVGAGHHVRVLTTDAGAVDAYYRLGVPVVSGAASCMNGVEVVRVRLAGGLYPSIGAVTRLLPAVVRRGAERRALQATRAWLRRQFDREIHRYVPDVVLTMPHLVVNVESVLGVHRRRPFPLVMVPMLHEEDPGWDVATMRRALARAGAVVALTPGERRRLVEAYGVPEAAVFLGGMGVDVPAEIADGGGPRRTVVFLGRKAHHKGIFLLLNAMQMVWRVKPDARLVLAGARGPASDDVAAAVAALPPDLRARVSLEDDVSEARKHAILGEAACLALPSRAESFGGVILEAWASAVPVIALDLPVFRDIVSPGADGSLVAPDDPRALADAIIWMLAHDEARAAMGRAGRRKACAQFTWPAVCEGYLAACRYAVEAFERGTGM